MIKTLKPDVPKQLLSEILQYYGANFNTEELQQIIAKKCSNEVYHRLQIAWARMQLRKRMQEKLQSNSADVLNQKETRE